MGGECCAWGDRGGGRDSRQEVDRTSGEPLNTPQGACPTNFHTAAICSRDDGGQSSQCIRSTQKDVSMVRFPATLDTHPSRLYITGADCESSLSPAGCPTSRMKIRNPRRPKSPCLSCCRLPDLCIILDTHTMNQLRVICHQDVVDRYQNTPLEHVSIKWMKL